VPIVEMMLNTTMAGKTVGQFLEDFLGPILWNSISAENFSNKFFIIKFYYNYPPKNNICQFMIIMDTNLGFKGIQSKLKFDLIMFCVLIMLETGS
jgi:hypothetical protein